MNMEESLYYVQIMSFTVDMYYKYTTKYNYEYYIGCS